MADHHQLSNFIWQIADLLRGPYRAPQYERVILPLVVLRRFDCVLEPTKIQVIAEFNRLKDRFINNLDVLDPKLNAIAGWNFHNHSYLTFEKLKGDPDRIDAHIADYINGFSKNVREIFERFDFFVEVEKMREANILYLVVSKFCDIDLHINTVDNIDMGLLFEDLIRRFNEAANETAGDHFTPREVIRLMVDILFAPDDETLTEPDKVIKMLDPACGTGGMLTEAQKHLRELRGSVNKSNKIDKFFVYGQDFNPRSYAIAASDLLMKGNDSRNIGYGDSFTNDHFAAETFDYLISNPPFGVDWKKQQKAILEEHEKLGFKGRFGAGLPRVNDGSLLFLQHMISKFDPFEPEQGKYGSRLAVVFNGSPLFTGGASSGESEIRKWVIENDWLEAIIALPEQMFYNTGIGTYIWIVTNRKEEHRRSKIQLIDARERWQPMRRSLGDKRRYLGEADIAAVVCEYGKFGETETSKIFSNETFGYNRVPIERPLRLLYTMDIERKSRFLDAVPHLLDDIQAIDRELGRTPRTDWNEFDDLMTNLLKSRGSKWKKAEHKLFRDVFTEVKVEPEIERVILERRKADGDPNARVWGWFPDPESSSRVVMYEPNAQLRDFENVQLAEIANRQLNKAEIEQLHEEKIVNYLKKEVMHHVRDAWADREKKRSAFEINFNRHFYKYTPPRSLAEIDADIKQMEEEIIRLLREVTA